MAFDLSNYETVESRLARFWETFPDGRVETTLMNYDGESCIVRSIIWKHRDDAHPTATGYAHEIHTDRGVNMTSFVENCESSSLGRVLANMGFAKQGARPSREEMEKVQRVAAGVPVANDDLWNEPVMAVVNALAAPDDREPNNRAFPCKHGTRMYNSGKNATTGKKWEGYFCDSPQHKADQCAPVGMDGKEWAKR